MSLLTSVATYTLGGITFNNGVADANGTRWWASIDGWESADADVEAEPREAEHGSDFIPGHYTGRTLTLEGSAVATSLAALKTSRDVLAAAVGKVMATSLLVVADPVPTQAQVYRVDRLRWRPVSRTMAEFSVILKAPDPRRYSTTVTTTSLGIGLATPAPSSTTSPTGGSLAHSTIYSYRVSAVGSAGETSASSSLLRIISALATPGKPTITTSPTGGSLPAAGSYGYRVSAVNAAGETLASTEATISTGGSGGSTRSNTVSWSPVSGATGYNVYGRTISGELKMTPTAITATSFLDDGSVTPSGALPTSNTTATNTNTISLSWSPVAGATGYNVYGRTNGSELKMTPTPITATTFTDTGSVTPSGALPSGSAVATTVTNAGTFEAGTEPKLTVTGPATGPIAISNGSPAKTVKVDTALGSGETLVVDFTAGVRTVTVNGQSRYDLLDSTTQWWALAPGANLVTYSGGGTASLDHRNAW